MNLNTVKLPPETAKLWLWCENEPLLSGFYLMGGTALALLIQHRVSEDLDFFYPRSMLPVDQLNRFIAKLRKTGHTAELKANWEIYEDFKQAGESLFDYHMNLLVNGIRCSFTAGRTFDHYTRKLITTPLNTGGPTVPSIGELFATKAVVVSQREKTRDWLDLYILMKDYGFSVADFFKAYEQAGRGKEAVAALEHLGLIPLDHMDEGYNTLIKPAPSLKEIRDFFAVLKKK